MKRRPVSERREALFDAMTKASEAASHLTRAYALGVVNINREDDRTICLQEAGRCLRQAQEAYDEALGGLRLDQ